tara:strand:+ start:219 stop:557 length:339 start_codon:yes stop_codon:yes gene_type:complete
MGKKKKAFLEFERFGKVRRKWRTKFAKLLELKIDKLRKNKKAENTESSPPSDMSAPPEKEVVENTPTETVPVKEKPKTTRKRKTPTKKATPATKKTTSTTRKRRTTKTKPDA